MKKRSRHATDSRPGRTAGLKRIYSNETFAYDCNFPKKPANLLTMLYSQQADEAFVPSGPPGEPASAAENAFANMSILCHADVHQARFASWTQPGLVFAQRETLRRSLAQVRQTAKAVGQISAGNWDQWLQLALRFKDDIQYVTVPASTGEVQLLFNLNDFSTWREIEHEIVSPHVLLARARRAVQLAFRLFLSHVDRAILRALRRLNKSFRVILKILGGADRLREFVGKQRAWYLLHGAHPPRLSAIGLIPMFGPINLLGVAA
jgi:hypothetical protein